jgi:copper chaperone
MKISLKVPTIACEVCAKTITKCIKNVDNQAIINIDVTTKIVSVESEKTIDNIKEAIMDAGHEIQE